MDSTEIAANRSGCGVKKSLDKIRCGEPISRDIGNRYSDLLISGSVVNPIRNPLLFSVIRRKNLKLLFKRLFSLNLHFDQFFSFQPEKYQFLGC